ncbi:DUF2062 domain-containing protein [Desulfomonile tiedjei]|uniref:DUF2062 domain-containing protein n=1 Tax=Desulfomonile tiedjei (strain ATCC 49306 / DSM 6799 / DCB-1) TaxID=706587 RepID=I4CF54_DESTA|nr:DUF2062 domain-containing protein [Desulfomonile tiedjei]AFM28195.1 hypothetical protein Desti_5615 [Desulfomonile tiedjei DSM 6799]
MVTLPEKKLRLVEFVSNDRDRSPEDLSSHSLETRRKGLFGFAESLVRSENPPWFDARGAAVGLIVGFGVPVGAQMIILAVFRFCFRFNAVLAFALTWVNNPLSLLPMYYGYYYLGSLILGRNPAMGLHDFRMLMQPILHAGYFWNSVHAFLLLSYDILVRWALAAVLVAMVTGLIGYVATYRIQRRRLKKRAREMGIAYALLVNRMETAIEDK